MKKLWKENRILFVLIIILIVCFLTIIGVAFSFFYSKNVSNYGERLNNIEKYPLKESFKKDYKNSFTDNENVSKFSLDIKGKIIYVNVDFKDEMSLDDAKKLCESSLALFKEGYLDYYDVQFILRSKNFNIIGAKNSIIDHISWNNNTPVEDETDEEK